jgi:Flp pilus assembly pilin Flp
MSHETEGSHFMFFYVGVLWDVLVGRVQALREEEHRDLGASALEWAIIAAIAVVIATVIGTVVYNVVQKKGNDLQNCANKPVGASCN